MSNVLLDERLIAFIPSLAREIGTNEAIVLQQINYWLQRSNKIHAGKRWVYKSAKKWVEEEFVFMSESTLKRTISNLKDMGLIESAKLSKHTGYHINYYSINDIAVSKLDDKIKREKLNNLKESTGSECNGIGSEWHDDKVNMNLSRKGQSDTTITESTQRLPSYTKEGETSKNKEVKFSPVKPNDVTSQVWTDLLQLRKTKRAVESQTAWTRINNAIDRAQQATGHSLEDIYSYWVMRAWSGFDDKWYINAHKDQSKLNHQGNNYENSQPKKSASRSFDDMLDEQLAAEQGGFHEYTVN